MSGKAILVKEKRSRARATEFAETKGTSFGGQAACRTGARAFAPSESSDERRREGFEFVMSCLLISSN